MAGMFAGILGAGLAFSPFFATTAFGAWTVPQLLHVPYAVVAGAIVQAFAVAVRRPILIAVALVTALGGSPYRTHTVEPRELAAWIVEKKPGLQIVDARAAAEFALVRIPRSENRPGDGAITVRAAGRSSHDVVFTANTTAAIKLVAESYPFGAEHACVLSIDNHNSVNGIREYARAAGAAIRYVDLGRGGLPPISKGLFAFPAQSN